MENQIIEWSDIKGFIKRRSKFFGFTFFAIFLSAVITAFTLPPIYRAETTIVIEEQQIPEHYVGSAVTTYVEERLNNIKLQVFSSERLFEIIEKFNLYPEIREKQGMGEALRAMHKSIGMETESFDFTNPKTGRTVSATIAFILFFEGKDPLVVQNVTNMLSDLFLKEDTKIKERTTTATTDFLSKQIAALREQLQFYDHRISDFKQEHLGELPEHINVNLAAIANLERELDRVNTQIQDMQNRKIIFEGQKVTVDPLLPINVDGESVARNPAERLKYLRMKLISLQSVLHDKHPDIAKAKREIIELENQVGVTVDPQNEIKRLNSLKAELAAMEGHNEPKHPDVVKLTKEIELLEQSIANKEGSKRIQIISQNNPDNPVYINLMTQISSVDAAIANLINERQRIEQELSTYRKRIENSPLVEKEYNDITRDYHTKKKKYDDLMNKLLDSNIAKGIEQKDHGQRFEIKNYAYLPGKPHKPNKMAIITLGFVLAAVFGLGIVSIQEYFDHSIKNEKELNRLFNVPVLAVISKNENQKISESSKVDEKSILNCETTIEYSSTKIQPVSHNVLKNNKICALYSDYKISDQIKTMRSQVLKKLEKIGTNIMMITSANPGEGKTFTSINLGISIAQELDRTVLIIDADLKNPTTGHYDFSNDFWGFDVKNGLADVLTGKIQLNDALINPGIDKLTILPGGNYLYNSAELLGSQKMELLVNEVKSKYLERIVIFDTPAVLRCADPVQLAKFVESVLFVVEEEKTSQDDIRQSMKLLSDIHMVGMIMNKSKLK